MAKNDFRYVVKTELQLSNASVANLLKEVRGVDSQIKSVVRNSARKIDLELGIDKAKSISNIHSETAKIVKNYSEHQAPSIKLKLDLDRASIGQLKHELNIITNQLSSYARASKNIGTEAKVNTIGTKPVQDALDKEKFTAHVKVKIDDKSLSNLKKTIEDAIPTAPITLTPASQRPVADNSHRTANRFGGNRARTSTTSARPASIGSTARSWEKERNAKKQELSELKNLLKTQQQIDHLTSEYQRASVAKTATGKMFSKSYDGVKKKVDIEEYKRQLEKELSQAKELQRRGAELEKIITEIGQGDKFTTTSRNKNKRVPRDPKGNIYKAETLSSGVEHRTYNSKKIKDSIKQKQKEQEIIRKQKEALKKEQDNEAKREKAKKENEARKEKTRKENEARREKARKENEARRESLAKQKKAEREKVAKEKKDKQDNERNNDYRKGLRRFGHGNQQFAVTDVDKVLKNPQIGIETKNKVLQKALGDTRNLAVKYGQDMTKSWEIWNREMDGTLTKARTNTYEFSKFGQVVERNDKSFGGMLKRVAQNSFAYAGITSAFYAISQGVVTAVNHMADFEVQLNRVQMLTTDLSDGTVKKQYADIAGAGPNSLKGNVSSQLHDTSGRLGVSAKDVVSPIYQKVLARTSLLGKGSTQEMTDKILDYAMVTLGPTAINADSAGAMADDILSIMQNMPETLSKEQKKGKTSDLLDFMALMNNSGVDTTSVTDALSEISVDTSKKGIDDKQVAAMLGAYNLSDRDASGQVMATVGKTFFGNLSKYRESTSVQDALRIVDIDPTKEHKQSELVDTILKNYQDLSDTEKEQFSMKIASASGRGKEQAPKIQKMLDSVGKDDYDKFDKALKNESFKGNLDKALESNLNNLVTKLGKAGQEISRLIDLMSQLGALDGIGLLVSTFTNLLKAVNGILEPIAKVSNYFEDIAGFSFIKIGAQLGAIALTLKTISSLSKFTSGLSLGDIVGGMIGGKGKANGVGSSTIASTVLGGAMQAGIETVAGGRNAKTPSVNTPKTGGVASTVGSLLGTAGSWMLSPSWKKSAGSGEAGAKVARTATDGVAKFASRLATIGPVALRLVSIFGKLTLAGLALEGVFLAFKGINKLIEKRQENRAKDEQDFLKNYGGAKDKGDMGQGTNKSNNVFKNFQEDLKTYVSAGKVYSELAGNKNLYTSNTPEGKAVRAEMDALKKQQQDIQKKFGDSIKFEKSNTPGGPDRIRYTYETKDKEGKTVYKEKAIMADDKKAINTMIERKTGRRAGSELPSDINPDAWTLASERAFEYEKELYRINELTEEFNMTMSKLNYDMGGVDLNFMGATGSYSALKAKAGIITSTMSELQGTIGDLQTRKVNFSEQANLVDGDINKIKGGITGGNFMSSKELEDEITRFKISNEAGDTSQFFNKYSTDDSYFDKYEKDLIKGGASEKKARKETDKKREENTRMNDLFANITASEGFLNAEKQLEQQMLQTNMAIQEREAQLKELRAQMLYTASGVDIMTARLGQLQNITSSATMFASIADTDEEKLKAGKSLLNAQMGELDAYKSQLSGIQNQMNNIKSQSPGQDFSLNALYNPGEEGLTEQQNAYRMLLEKQNEVFGNINSSTTAIKQQADAIRDMVLNSDKYADMWERVQGRIQLAKDSQRELFNNKNDASTIKQVSGVTSALTGESRASVTASKYESMRDKNLAIYEKSVQALTSYKGDSEKLSKALDEVDKTLGKEFDTAFISPLKDMMQSHIDPAVANVNQAGEYINLAAENLNSVLSYWADNVTNNLLQQQTEDFTESITGGADAKTIGKFDARDKGTSGKTVGQMNTSEILDAYITQTYGVQPGSQQFMQYKRQMQMNYTPAEIKSQLAPKVTSSTSNSAVYKYNSSMKKVLRGGLSGYENSFSKAGAKYGIDPRLIASIAMAETGGKINSKNNIGGVMGSNGLKSYASVGDSIDDLARILKQVYFDQGLNTIPKIQQKYAPSGAANDPGGLNNNWQKNVSSFYSQMTGISQSDLLGSSGSATIKKDTPSSGGSGSRKLSGWGGTQTSQYGWRKDPFTGKSAYHNGIDIAGKKGSRLDANVDGKVIASGLYGPGSGYSGYGNVVVIKDSKGMQHMYAHLDKTIVKVGDTIKKGQKVGTIGSTGKSTGPHLHYEVRKNGYGTNVDPTKYYNEAKKAKVGGSSSSSAGAKLKEANKKSATEIQVAGIKALKEAFTSQLLANRERSASNIKRDQGRQYELDVGLAKVMGDPVGKNVASTRFAGISSQLQEVYSQKMNNNWQIKDLQKERKTQAKVRDDFKKSGKTEQYNAQKKVVAEIDKMIKELKNNSKSLDKMQKTLEKKNREDPTIHGGTASKTLKDAYKRVGKYKKNSVEYYQGLQDINEMNSTYMSTKKKGQILTDYWNTTGKDTFKYGKVKVQNAKDDINLNKNKMKAINMVIADFAQGTFEWHSALEDAVALMKQIDALEQQRLDNAREYFQQTGKGVEGVITQQAYIDTDKNSQNTRNLKTAIGEHKDGKITGGYGFKTGTYTSYKSAEKAKKVISKEYGVSTTIVKDGKKYRVVSKENLTKGESERIQKGISGKTKGKTKVAKVTSTTGGKKKNMSHAEELASLKLIASIYDELQQSLTDYRNAVQGGFKAGALSIKEYLKEMNKLRDLQSEARENALAMIENMSDLFASSISSAIADGMRGGFDSSQGFIDSMKSGISSMLSSAIADTLIKNTGIQDVMNKLITSVTTAATSGKPQDIVNMFNNNDFAKQFQSAFDAITPLIEQIVASTDGIFSIMKDQMFNAPSGFKIDDYLYDMAKGKKFDQVKNWQNGDKRNEAGSSIGGGSKGSDNIKVTPPKDKPTGQPTGTDKPPNGTVTGDGAPKNPTPAPKPKDPKPKKNTPKKDDKKKGGKGGKGGKKDNKKDDKKKTTANYFWYTIKKGDTLSELAEKYLGGASKYGQITSLNKGLSTKNLKVGQKIKIPKKASAKKPTKPKTKTKTVKSPVNLRSTAGYNGKVLQVLPKGAKVQYLGDSKGWAKVKYNNKTGYVGHSFIYHTGGIAGVKNFANANSLKPDEVSAIMKKGELALRPGQILDFVKNFLGTIKLPETIPTNGGGNGIVQPVLKKPKFVKPVLPSPEKIKEERKPLIEAPNGHKDKYMDRYKELTSYNLDIKIDLGNNNNITKQEVKDIVEESLQKSLKQLEKSDKKHNLVKYGTSYGKK